MLRILIASAALLLVAAIATADIVGPGVPTTCAEDSSNGSSATWGSPSNALGFNDQAYATSSLNSGQTSRWLKCTNFSTTINTTSLPNGTIIQGIVVEVRAKANPTVDLPTVRLVKGGSILTTNRKNLTSWGAAENTFQIGDPFDLWGTTWNASDLTGNTNNFGVVIAAKDEGASGRTASVDGIRITVYTGAGARVYAQGFDTWSISDGSTWGSTAGTAPTFSTAAKRTGNGGLLVTCDGNICTESRWMTPASIDGSMTAQGWGRFYLVPNGANDPLPLGGSTMVAAWRQCTNTTHPCDTEAIGCYVLLERAADGTYALHPRYHGRETSADIEYKSYPLPPDWPGSGVKIPVTLGQRIIAPQVACPLSMQTAASPYASVEAFNATMGGDCTGGQCDLTAFQLGTSAPGSIANYATFSALNVGYDDFVIDTSGDPGVGYERPLFPSAISTSTWGSNVCPSTSIQCPQDWKTGFFNDCTLDANARKDTGSDVELLDLDDLSNTISGAYPVFGASDQVKSVTAYALCCATAAHDVLAAIDWKYSATEVTSTVQNIPLSTTAQLLTDFRLVDPTGVAWNNTIGSTTVVDGLKIGYNKTTSNGVERCTAVLAYVDVETPSPMADRNIQDALRCTSGADLNKGCRTSGDCAGGAPCAGDGLLNALTICDSITASTATGLCVGGTCTAACTVDGDCPTGLVSSTSLTAILEPPTCQSNGLCSYACSTNDDCAAECGGTCSTADFLASKLTTTVPQFDTIIDCGAPGQPDHWILDALAQIIVNPYSHALDPNNGITGPCTLVNNGRWGTCATSGNPCKTAADCDQNTSEACNSTTIDVIYDLCGANNQFHQAYAVGQCDGAPPYPEDIWGQRTCPMAHSSPGAYEFTRLRCDDQGTPAQAKTYCQSNVSAGSQCMGYCAGHSDPVRPCASDYDCTECSDNTLRTCYRFGTCVSSSATSCGRCSNDTTAHCQKSADCGAGNTCTARCTDNLSTSCKNDFGCIGGITACYVDGDCTGGRTCQASSACAGCGDTDCPTGEICNVGTLTCQPPFSTCTVDGDCPVPGSETCSQWTGTYDHNWGTDYGACDTCNTVQCNRDVRYCTIPCAALTCTTDDQCAAAGGEGGICVSGHCWGCGDNGTMPAAPTAAQQTLFDRKLTQGGAHASVPDQMAREAQLEQIAKTAGVTLIHGTYGGTFMMDSNGIPPVSLMVPYSINTIYHFQNVIDLFNAFPIRDDTTQRSLKTIKTTAQLSDIAHNSAFGASVHADIVGDTLNALYPVCSLDPTIECGFCDVTCTTAATDCAVPLATPAVTPGTCSTPVAGGGPNRCKCTTSANCAAGCSCTDIGGSDKRCICEKVTDCPTGDSQLARWRYADDTLCPGGKGTCTDTRIPPLCTVWKNRCTTPGDCFGYSKHDICAIDGAWIPCTSDFDCKNSGVYAADHCAGPIGTPTPTVGAGTPTPKPANKVCQASTPTP